jgi:hypothetical protein
MLDVYEDRIGEALDPILGKLLKLRSDLRECNSMIENLEPLESGQMQIEDHRGRPLLRARLLAERDQAYTRAESRYEHLDENSVWKEIAQFWRDKPMPAWHLRHGNGPKSNMQPMLAWQIQHNARLEQFQRLSQM